MEIIKKINMKIGRNDNCPCGSGKKYKKCCLDKQPREKFIYIGYKEPFEAIHYEKDTNEIKIETSSGDTVMPDAIFSRKEYMRKSGKIKVVNMVPDVPVVNTLSYLAGFDKVFAIDTNTKKIQDHDISVGVIIESNFELHSEGTRVKVSYRENGALVFKNCDFIHPEKYSWLKLFDLIENFYSKDVKIAVITDHDLGNLSTFNKREIPYWDNHYVPENCKLIYAGSDNKNDDVINSFVARSDYRANEILRGLSINGIIEITGQVIELDKIPNASAKSSNYKT